MLNMIDTQDKLKNFSEQQLIQEMQRPSGSAPQFMVLGEIERRKRMRADAQRQEGLMQPTVAQEAVSAAGVPQQGIAQVAQSLAPQTDMTQNTGVPNVQAAGLPGQPNQPQRMADGGILRLQVGGYPDDLSRLVATTIAYGADGKRRGYTGDNINANVIDAYLRGELDPSFPSYGDMVNAEKKYGRAKLREVSSQIANPYGMSPSYSSRDEITPRMSQEDAMATRRRLASGIGTGAGIASVPAALPYERGAGRATRVNGTFVEVMPDGNVFDIETGDMVTGELAQAAVTKLTPNLTVDSAAFAEAQDMPSVYNPEAGMPSQADLDLRAAEAPAPDRFPNDLSPAETAAAYNAAQEKRRAEAARMTGINQIPTTQPTFRDDVLPFVGGIAGDLASLPVDIIAEGVAGTPEERLMAMPVEAGDPTQARITMLRRIIDNPAGDATARATAAQELQELQTRIAVTQTGGNLAATAENGGINIPEGYAMGAFGLVRDPNYRSPGKTGNSLVDQAALQGTEALTTLAESGAVDPALTVAAKSVAQQADFERDIYPINLEISQLNAAANNPYLPEDLKSGIAAQITNLEDQKSGIATATQAAPPQAPDVDAAPQIDTSPRVGGYTGLIDPNPPSSEVATTKAVSDANRQAADSMQGTGITGVGSRQVADAIATIKDPNAMPKGGTSTGKKSGILAEKSKMDQDKWLALAQAGFVLMSTGDFGKAGSAGLAALRESNKDAREERKLEAELVLREAQLAKANRGTAAKTAPASLVTAAASRLKTASDAMSSAVTPAQKQAAADEYALALQEYNNLQRFVASQYGYTGGSTLAQAGPPNLSDSANKT